MSWKRNGIEAMCRLASRFAPRLSTPPESPRSIFVLRNNDIGDLLVITPLFAALRRRFPEAKIIAGVGSWNFDVLRGNPHVDEVLPMDAPWHNGRIRSRGLGAALRYIAFSNEVKELARCDCDVGIDVLGSPQGSLLLMRARIPWRLGVRGYAGGDSAAQQWVDYDEHVHVGDAALRFAELLGATELPENRPQIYLPSLLAALRRHRRRSRRRLCRKVLGYRELRRIAGSVGPAPSHGHRWQTRPCRRRGTGPWAVLCAGLHRPGPSLRETFALIAGARAVVCNPSMAMHAAAAFRKPCLVLLGKHFTDAAQHAAQWAYPETRVLGRSADHPEVWTPEEAHRILADLMAAP